MSYSTLETSAAEEQCTVKGTHWVKNMVKFWLNYAYCAKDAAPTFKRTVATATATATLTAAQMVTAHHIDGTPTGAATYTTLTAAELVAAIPGVAVGTSYYLSINNSSAGANTITLAGGTTVTVDGTLTVEQNVCRLFLVTFTNVTAASEAVTIYGMGA